MIYREITSADFLGFVKLFRCQKLGFLQFTVRPRNLALGALEVLVELVPLMVLFGVTLFWWFVASPMLPFVG